MTERYEYAEDLKDQRVYCMKGIKKRSTQPTEVTNLIHRPLLTILSNHTLVRLHWLKTPLCPLYSDLQSNEIN